MTLLALHVTPRSSHNVVTGVKTIDGLTEVHVRVTAPPDGGKANAAVCKIVAKELGIAKGKVTVKRGDTSRHKQVEITLDQSEVDTWVASLPTL